MGLKSGARQRWDLKLDFVGATSAALPGGKDLAQSGYEFNAFVEVSQRQGTSDGR